MELREVIPNGIYGRRVRDRIQAVIIERKDRFGLDVRPFYESVNVWGIGERVRSDELFPLPAGNPRLIAAIRARNLRRPDRRGRPQWLELTA